MTQLWRLWWQWSAMPLGLSVALLAFHALVPSGQLSWQSWLAAAAAMLCLGVTDVCLFLFAWLHTRARPSLLMSIAQYAADRVLPLALGLLAVEVLWNDPKGVIPLAVVATGVWWASRSATPVQPADERRKSVARRESAADIDSQLEKVVMELLVQARADFGVKLAQLVIYSGSEGLPSFRTTLRDEGDPDSMVPAHVAITAALTEIETIRLTPTTDVETRQALLVPLEVRHGVSAILREDGRTIASLTVANRVDTYAAAFGSEDIARLVTFGHGVTATLQRHQLDKSIADLAAHEADLTFRAFHDTLTGLANRALFADRVEHARRLAERNDMTIAILVLDLDNFKELNDKYGQTVGDAVLVEVARRIRWCLRGADTPARFGSDEFGILLEQLRGALGAQAVVNRMLTAMAEPFVEGSIQIPISASIGVSVAEEMTIPTAELIRRADVAMYSAKETARGGSVIYSAKLAAARTAAAATPTPTG